MAKSKEELLARAKVVRAALKQPMSAQQEADHKAALERKASRGGGGSSKDPLSGAPMDEFEASIDRSLARFLEALEGVERHHKRSWLTSAVVQDFAAALDTIRNVVPVTGGAK